MNKKLFLFSLFLSFIIFSVAETWHIASLNWEPYCGENLPDQGILVKKLRFILKKKNIKLEVDYYPWGKSKKLAEGKDYIGYFPAWPEGVKKGFIASPSIGQSSIGIISYKDSDVECRDMRHLFKRHKVGLVKTYVYPKSIIKVMREYPKKTVFVKNEKVLIHMVSRKGIEAAVTDPLVSKFYSKKYKYNNIVTVAESVIKRPLVIAFQDTPENRERIKLLRKLLRKESE
ncbi:MAG: hypothetical protein FXF47_09915 [Candidatus Mcinerneyibacterium aminivorans]|uniref:Transporter substrate-binding domain-containing protein n=1 Tax=Candidatus Mcinerneyibacterium aminivorans TaxID=2703815 RepID=A0A5D0MGD0_9BACT|nr:MAG: hypothetical protein FXF47_09915 [Candidatus Mcinerneyibacterium aminivorans]